MDLDGDGKLTMEEFLQGMKPQEPYSKMLIKQNLDKKQKALAFEKSP